MRGLRGTIALLLVAWLIMAIGCSREESPAPGAQKPSRESQAHQVNTLVMWKWPTGVVGAVGSGDPA
jgi:hypothetical protein